MRRVLISLMIIACSGVAVPQPINYVAKSGSEFTSKHGEGKRYFEFYADHEYDYIREQLDDIDLSLVRSHKLGEEVALYLHLLDQEYTYITEAAPGSFSGRLVVKKPAIYNSVYRIDKYYRKQIRKGLLTDLQGKTGLIKSVEIALILLNRETGEFEAELDEAKKDEELLTLFRRIKLKSY
jgi:hypothetical protein